jgi:hypothetical protein
MSSKATTTGEHGVGGIPGPHRPFIEQRLQVAKRVAGTDDRFFDRLHESDPGIGQKLANGLAKETGIAHHIVRVPGLYERGARCNPVERVQNRVQVSGLGFPTPLGIAPAGWLVIMDGRVWMFPMELLDDGSDPPPVCIVTDQQCNPDFRVILLQDGLGGLVHHLDRLAIGGDNDCDLWFLTGWDRARFGHAIMPVVDHRDQRHDDGHQDGPGKGNRQPGRAPVETGKCPRQIPGRRDHDQDTGHSKFPVLHRITSSLCSATQ